MARVRASDADMPSWHIGTSISWVSMVRLGFNAAMGS